MPLSDFIELRKQMVDDKKIFEYLPFKTKPTLKKWRERIFKELNSDDVMKVVVKVDSKNFLYHMDNFPMYISLLSTKDEQDRIRGKKKCES